MRTFMLAVTGLVFFSVAACSSGGTSVIAADKTPAKVASVAVSVPASLVAGQTARAVAIPKDENGTPLPDRAVTWYSSAASIANVTDSGVISAVAPGTTVVSAVSEGASGRANMTVMAPPPSPVANVMVAVSPSAAVIGQTAIATATLLDSTGTQLSGRTVTWESSNTAVATVDASGDVKAVGSGMAMIKASSEGKGAGSPFNVSAPAPIPVASISVSPTTSTLQIGGTVQLSAVTRDANNNVLTGRLIAWSSANTTIATVSSAGLVTAIAAGTVAVTASSEGQSAPATITVSAPAPVPVASVSVSPGTSTLQVAGKVQLSAVTRDANNNVLSGRVVSWSSSNTGLATVSSSGLVTAVAAGSATITALSEGKSGTSVITVSAPAPVPVAAVTVSPNSSTLQIAATVQLSAITRDANNNVLSGRVVSWSSNSSGVATVSSSGLVTAVAAGSATITALSEGKSGTSVITVSAPAPVPVATVSVTPSSTSITVGSTVQLSAVTRDANNNVLTGRAISWTSGTPATGSVSGAGLVTGLVVGSTTITATSEGKTGTSVITVTAAPPPPPPGSVEPSGMTTLTERPFTSLNEDGWSSQGDYSIQSDALAPYSPSSVGQIRFQAGFGSGNAPAVLEKVWSGSNKTLYVSFWLKLSSNWYGNDAGVNKIFHFWIGDSNRLVLNARGTGNGTLTAEVELQGIVAGGNYDGGTTALFEPNLGPSGTIVRGTWLHWEAIFTGNSSGTADGKVEWWLNGTKVGSYSGLQFISGTGVWQEMEWSPTYGGSGAPVPATQYQWIDHVRISGK
jgi:uncharacterized protein YjdB